MSKSKRKLTKEELESIKYNESIKIPYSDVMRYVGDTIIKKANNIIEDNGIRFMVDNNGDIRSSDFGFGSIAKISSERLLVFKKNNKCINCGISGSYYKKTHALVGKNLSYHLNLYNVHDNSEVMLTKDHLLPKSLGGKDYIDNYITCCEDCNLAKGNSLLSWEEIHELFKDKTINELKSIFEKIPEGILSRIKNRVLE